MGRKIFSVLEAAVFHAKIVKKLELLVEHFKHVDGLPKYSKKSASNLRFDRS